MKMMNFIVVDEITKGKSQQYTIVDQVFIPIGVSIPVIVKGSGCEGIGIISELRIKENSTTIFYELTKDISDEAKNAYYSLYRNQVSSNQRNNDNDDYEYNKDVIIPGAMTSLKSNKSKPVKKKKNKKTRTFSPSGRYDDDDDYWDEDDYDYDDDLNDFKYF